MPKFMAQTYINDAARIRVCARMDEGNSRGQLRTFRVRNSALHESKSNKILP